MNNNDSTSPSQGDSSAFSIFEAGPMSAWRNFCFDVPGLPAKSKQFLKAPLQLTSMEVSLNAFIPGEDMPFVHRHQHNEELYVFLSGRGEFQADGQLFPVRAGTCIRCAPEVARTWRNTGDVDLVFLVIQGLDGSLKDHFGPQDGRPVRDQRPLWSA